MKTSIRKKWLLALSCATAMFAAGAALTFDTVSVDAAETLDGKGTINVYLIGGQSNAVGYGLDNATTTLASTDTRYTDGFENVLYYGEQERKSETIDNVTYTSFAVNEAFQPVTLGMGRTLYRSGAEIGIASAVNDDGGTSAVIKCAYGAAYLYPDTTINVSKTQGTWTSPSYIEENSIETEGTRIGGIYNTFIDTVADGLALLEAQGYTPVIKGMWWMQGEAETEQETPAAEYDALLTALISDVREDLAGITGLDQSEMPFVMGSIYRNPSYETKPYLTTVQTAQTTVASSLKNVSVVDISKCPVMRQHDSWHFDAATQNWIGQQFVAEVKAMNADADEFKENITMFNGAKVRTVDPIGIRFGAKITDYNAENGYQYGFTIFPTDYLTKYSITGDYLAQFEKAGVKIGTINCAVLYDDFDGDGIKEHYIQGSLINIQYNNLTRPYTGVAYIIDAGTDGEHGTEDDVYLYTSAAVQRSVAYLSSAAMIYDYENLDDEYSTLLNFTHGGVHSYEYRKDKTDTTKAEDSVKADNTYIESDFAIEVEKEVSLDLYARKALTVTQTPAMGYAMRFISYNKNIVTVDERGILYGVNPGTTTVVLKCAFLSIPIQVTVNPDPVLDGKVDTEYYGDTYMHYQFNGTDAGYSDVFVYTYNGDDATYVAVEVIGTTTISDDRGGIIFMAKNPTDGTGKYFRAYGNGTVKENTLANLTTNNNSWTSKTDYLASNGGVEYMKASYDALSASGVTNRFVVEFKLDYEDYGVSSADALSLCFGWISLTGAEMVYDRTTDALVQMTESGTHTWKSVVENTSGNYWWTTSDIEERKAADTKAIRLDGYVDGAYTNSFTYTAETKQDGDNPCTEVTNTTLYWYETDTALYLAFDVTDFTRTYDSGTVLKTRQLNFAPSGTQGSAGVSFAVTPVGTTSAGVWYRAFGSNTQMKTLTAIETSHAKGEDLYGTTVGRLDYIRGNEGALYNTNRTDITSYTIEVRIDYATYGVTSASELQILFGGLQYHSALDWFYDKDGGAYKITNTGTGGAGERLLDVNNETYKYWWTMSDLVNKMNIQKPDLVLDGKIETEYYGTSYMHYQSNISEAESFGYMDAFVYTYVTNASTYFAVEVVGPTTIADNHGGIIFMVKAPDGTGKYFRAYGNGTVKENTLANLTTNNNSWTGKTDYLASNGGVEYMKASYDALSASGVTNRFVVEFKLDYEDYGVTNANELSYVLGWIGADETENGREWVYKYDHGDCKMLKLTDGENTSPTSDQVYIKDVAADATGDYWWTLEEIKTRQERDTKAIRLDGYVDEAYTNSFTYTATTVSSDGEDTATETTNTTLYWYETDEALYLAFNVTDFERTYASDNGVVKYNRQLNYVASGTQGSAGINFAVSKKNSLDGNWYRAFGSNTQMRSLSDISDDQNLYPTTVGRLDYIRGNEGALYNTERDDITSYVIEVRIDYADYGVSSAAELKILFGGMQEHYLMDWFYDKDGGAFLSTTTTASEDGAEDRILDVKNETYQFWWTIEDFATEMAEQAKTDVAE